MSTHEAEQQLSTNIGWILVLLIVAGSSFLVGSSYRQNSPTQSASGAENTAPTGSVISDIQNTLQNPEAAPTDSAPALSSTPGLISINSATQAELETLPGIGPSKAQAIISYRQQNGAFVRIEDIQNVKGIGPKTFESLKSKITL